MSCKNVLFPPLWLFLERCPRERSISGDGFSDPIDNGAFWPLTMSI